MLPTLVPTLSVGTRVQVCDFAIPDCCLDSGELAHRISFGPDRLLCSEYVSLRTSQFIRGSQTQAWQMTVASDHRPAQGDILH